MTGRILNDILSKFKKDVPFVYRYGSLLYSLDLFNSLSPEEQKRIICVALTSDDRELNDVGNFLAKKLKPAPEIIDEFGLDYLERTKNGKSLSLQRLGGRCASDIHTNENTAHFCAEHR